MCLAPLRQPTGAQASRLRQGKAADRWPETASGALLREPPASLEQPWSRGGIGRHRNLPLRNRQSTLITINRRLSCEYVIHYRCCHSSRFVAGGLTYRHYWRRPDPYFACCGTHSVDNQAAPGKESYMSRRRTPPTDGLPLTELGEIYLDADAFGGHDDEVSVMERLKCT